MAQDDTYGSRKFYGLIEDLANPDSIAQEKATKTIIQLGEPVIEPLIAALEDNVSVIRQKAATMLGKLKAQKGIKPLSACLKDEDASVRLSAVESLGAIGGEDVIAPLLKALTDNDGKVCRRAASALAEIGRDALSPLIQSLSDESPSVRVFAAETLGKIASPEAVLPLAKVLATDADSQVQKQALTALQHLKSEEMTEVMDILLSALLDEDEQMRIYASIAIRGIGSREAINRLSEDIKSVPPQQRIQGIQALSVFGREAVESLIAALNDTDTNVQCAAIEALGNIRTMRSFDALLPLCDARDNRVRECALASVLSLVQRFDNADILERLEERLDDEYETVEARRGVVKILAQLGQNEKAMDLLLTALRDEDQRVRIGAVDALGEMRHAAAVEPIIAAMRDKNEWVRWHCAAALGKVGSEEAVPRLVVALREDRSWWVRYYAAEALGKIGTKEAIEPLLKVTQDELEDERVKIKAQEAIEKLRSCHKAS
ncbi:MAG: HEAT repeat domain-containing protein [Candidatus Poribacteria bacterium]